MIRHIDRPNGHFIHIGNGKLSCILKITYGKAELLHLGAPLNDADCEALCCETLLGLGTGVLYRQGDSRSCLDDLPLAWSERGTGDYRESPIELLLEGADICPDFVYSSSLPLYARRIRPDSERARAVGLPLSMSAPPLTRI